MGYNKTFSFEKAAFCIFTLSQSSLKSINAPVHFGQIQILPSSSNFALQVLQILWWLTVHLLLQHTPYTVVKGIEIRVFWRPNFFRTKIDIFHSQKFFDSGGLWQGAESKKDSSVRVAVQRSTKSSGSLFLPFGDL